MEDEYDASNIEVIIGALWEMVSLQFENSLVVYAAYLSVEARSKRIFKEICILSLSCEMLH